MDWAAISAAIAAWLTATTGLTAVRGNLNARRPSSPYLTFTRATGALPRGNVGANNYTCRTDQDHIARFLLDSPAPAVVSVEFLEGYPGSSATYSYTKLPGDNGRAIRDALVALINATSTHVVASNETDGKEALFTGEFGVGTLVGCTVTTEQAEVRVDEYRVAEFDLSVQSFVDAPGPDAPASAYDPDAMAYLDTVLASLSDRAALAGLIALDVEPVAISAPQDITALIGSELQGRAATTITFRVLQTSVRDESRLAAVEDPALNLP